MKPSLQRATGGRRGAALKQTMFYFVSSKQELVCGVTLTVALEISLCFSHSVLYKWFLGEAVWAAGLELSSALAPAPSLADFILLPELRGPPVQAALRCFSQTSAARFLSVWQGKEVEWKKRPPPHPLRPHGKGRRAVDQEPAGHSRAYLWSPLSSLQSEALCSPGSPPRCCSPLPLANPKKRRSREQPEKMHFLLTHYVPLFFLSQTIYTDGG